jgi:hypothetical protein
METVRKQWKQSRNNGNSPKTMETVRKQTSEWTIVQGIEGREWGLVRERGQELRWRNNGNSLDTNEWMDNCLGDRIV